MSPLAKLLMTTDWAKAAQGFGTFCRVLRGDSEAEIHVDSERIVAKASKLSTTLRDAAEKVASEMDEK